MSKKDAIKYIIFCTKCQKRNLFADVTWINLTPICDSCFSGYLKRNKVKHNKKTKDWK